MKTRRCVGVVLGGLVAAAVLMESPPASAGFCWFCGGNAATVGDGILFDELNVKVDSRHLHSPGKPWIESASLELPPNKGKPVTLEVTKDRLSVIDAHHRHYAEDELLGLRMVVKTERGTRYQVDLVKYRKDLFHFWGQADSSDHNVVRNVPSYLFTVLKLGPSKNRDAQPVNVCTTSPQEESREEQTRDPAENFKYAMVFEGDRFNADHTVVPEPKASGWFNLACYGTAAAKMHLLRHTEAGSTKSWTTSPHQKTAMLRAITADYCADGGTHTGDGTPLYWTDEGQWFPLADQRYAPPPPPRPDEARLVTRSFPSDVEAVWGLDGELLCLNEPRRDPDPHLAMMIKQPSPCTAPAVSRADVTKEHFCKDKDLSHIPLCTYSVSGGANPWTQASPIPQEGYVVTVNRKRVANYCNPK